MRFLYGRDRPCDGVKWGLPVDRGTGKYAGMKGNNTFSATGIGSTSEGRGLLKGEWQLP